MDLTLQDEAQVGDQVGMSIAKEGQGQGHNYFWHQNQMTVDISDFIDCSLPFYFFLGFWIWYKYCLNLAYKE